MSSIPPAFESYGEQSLQQAPAFGPGKDGVFEATLAREPGGETRLLNELSKVPYHLTGTLDIDPAPGMTTLCLQEPTGGVAQGDRHSMDVHAREHARGHVTTQSATKVHSMDANYAHLSASLSAEKDAHLEYFPGATILNERARCLQTITVDLDPESVVLVTDVLSPDGLTEHDPFDFDHYLSRIEARCDGKLICLDTVDLQPTDGRPGDPATMGECTSLGTLYAFTPALETDALADAVHGGVQSQEATAGVSELADGAGLSVRVLGHGTDAVEETIKAAWRALRRETLDSEIPADRWY
ncbi:MAG: urease accessory protein [Natronomonas sp.]|jgi:urease accessory protein